MKQISAVIISMMLLASHATIACDEACERKAAEAKHSVTFPSHLTWKYCDDIKYDFMTTDMRSLQSYSSKHFNTKYKGPIKNIVKLIDMRKEWLQECDVYLTKTNQDRIFYDKKTTKQVFGHMNAVSKELKDVIGGVTYSSSQGDETKKIVVEKFEHLFEAVDNHKNLMHLKGKYVYQ